MNEKLKEKDCYRCDIDGRCGVHDCDWDCDCGCHNNLWKRYGASDEEIENWPMREWDELCPLCGEMAEYGCDITVDNESWRCTNCGAYLDIPVTIIRHPPTEIKRAKE